MVLDYYAAVILRFVDVWSDAAVVLEYFAAVILERHTSMLTIYFFRWMNEEKEGGFSEYEEW